MKKFLIILGPLTLLYTLFLTSIVAQNFGRVTSAYIRADGSDVRRLWMPLSQISPALLRTVIAAEDTRFYDHFGVDLEEIEKELASELRRFSFARGFSTITMQVARNLYLSPRKSLARKTLEIIIALHLDLLLPKRRILEIYLNIAEWGEGIYGAEAAAQHYFRTSAAALSAEESAFLAAILPNPKKWGRWPPSPSIQKRMQVLLARTR